jgi:hypothetical protein
VAGAGDADQAHGLAADERGTIADFLDPGRHQRDFKQTSEISP